MTRQYFATEIGAMQDQITRLTAENTDLKKQLTAREARIAEIQRNLHQYRDDPYIEGAVRCFTQDDLTILREHEARLLEGLAKELIEKDVDAAEWLEREAAARRKS